MNLRREHKLLRHRLKKCLCHGYVFSIFPVVPKREQRVSLSSQQVKLGRKKLRKYILPTAWSSSLVSYIMKCCGVKYQGLGFWRHFGWFNNQQQCWLLTGLRLEKPYHMLPGFGWSLWEQALCFLFSPTCVVCHTTLISRGHTCPSSILWGARPRVWPVCHSQLNSDPTEMVNPVIEGLPCLNPQPQSENRTGSLFIDLPRTLWLAKEEKKKTQNKCSISFM